MSAGGDWSIPLGAVVHDSLELLAPRFREAVEAALRDCAVAGLDAVVHETLRTEELQRIYYARGRTVCPPWVPVTNARDHLESWHGYGLAVDVIHRTHRWDVAVAWYRAVAQRFAAHGCDWGGDWTHPDLPHFQWGTLRTSPSQRARDLYRAGGAPAVWVEVRAT